MKKKSTVIKEEEESNVIFDIFIFLPHSKKKTKYKKLDEN